MTFRTSPLLPVPSQSGGRNPPLHWLGETRGIPVNVALHHGDGQRAEAGSLSAGSQREPTNTPQPLPSSPTLHHDTTEAGNPELPVQSYRRGLRHQRKRGAFPDVASLQQTPAGSLLDNSPPPDMEHGSSTGSSTSPPPTPEFGGRGKRRRLSVEGNGVRPSEKPSQKRRTSDTHYEELFRAMMTMQGIDQLSENNTRITPADFRSHLSGVYFHLPKREWRAVIGRGNRRQQKTFSVRKYGFSAAKHHAEYFRTQFDLTGYVFDARRGMLRTDHNRPGVQRSSGRKNQPVDQRVDTDDDTPSPSPPSLNEYHEDLNGHQEDPTTATTEGIAEKPRSGRPSRRRATTSRRQAIALSSSEDLENGKTVRKGGRRSNNTDTRKRTTGNSRSSTRAACAEHVNTRSTRRQNPVTVELAGKKDPASLQIYETEFFDVLYKTVEPNRDARLRTVGCSEMIGTMQSPLCCYHISRVEIDDLLLRSLSSPPSVSWVPQKSDISLGHASGDGAASKPSAWKSSSLVSQDKLNESWETTPLNAPPAGPVADTSATSSSVHHPRLTPLAAPSRCSDQKTAADQADDNALASSLLYELAESITQPLSNP